jgi:hypothetical protein
MPVHRDNPSDPHAADGESETETDANLRENAEAVGLEPPAPPNVSAVKGILSSYSFLFFDAPGHYAMRKYSCWCKACTLVRGRGHDCVTW